MDVELQYDCIIKLLDSFKFLTDAYMVDFFLEDLWATLPESWRDYFDQLPSTELAAVLDVSTNVPLTNVPPLSVLALRSCCRYLSLSRLTTGLETGEILTKLHLRPVTSTTWTSYESELLNTVSGQNLNLAPHLRNRLKPKKQHEVSRLSQLIFDLRCALEVNGSHFTQVIDIGGGLGHLARTLSTQLDLSVLTVEADSKFTAVAQKIDEKSKQLHKADGDWKTPVHLNRHLDSLSEPVLGVHGCQRACVVGLHACGDLTPVVLREFIREERAKAVVSVGCCYMKLNGGLDKVGYQNWSTEAPNSLEQQQHDKSGYPLSRYASSRKPPALSYAARELACHHHELQLDRLLQYPKFDAEPFNIHCYRAALEVLLVRAGACRKLGLRGVKGAFKMQFRDYIAAAIRNQKESDLLQKVLKVFDANPTLVDSYLKRWKRVLVFYTLRSFLAPLIESAILLDRLLYLKEHPTVHAILVPIFDVSLSARNIALIAIKE